jgi:hypothetical protein
MSTAPSLPATEWSARVARVLMRRAAALSHRLTSSAARGRRYCARSRANSSRCRHAARSLRGCFCAAERRRTHASARDAMVDGGHPCPDHDIRSCAVAVSSGRRYRARGLCGAIILGVILQTEWAKNPISDSKFVRRLSFIRCGVGAGGPRETEVPLRLCSSNGRPTSGASHNRSYGAVRLAGCVRNAPRPTGGCARRHCVAAQISVPDCRPDAAARAARAPSSDYVPYASCFACLLALAPCVVVARGATRRRDG